MCIIFLVVFLVASWNLTHLPWTIILILPLLILSKISCAKKGLSIKVICHWMWVFRYRSFVNIYLCIGLVTCLCFRSLMDINSMVASLNKIIWLILPSLWCSVVISQVSAVDITFTLICLFFTATPVIVVKFKFIYARWRLSFRHDNIWIYRNEFTLLNQLASLRLV